MNTEVSIRSELTEANPHMPDFQGDHWKVVLRFNGRKLTTVFSKGYSHGGKAPESAEVLSCLFSDAYYAEYDVDEFADDLGYTKPSQAIRAHKACQATKRNLERLLGSDYDRIGELVQDY